MSLLFNFPPIKKYQILKAPLGIRTYIMYKIIHKGMHEHETTDIEIQFVAKNVF